MFVPKQAIIKDAHLYADLVTNYTQDIAEKALDLIPPISKPLVVHDNGCGTGEVTRALMARNPPNITIKANDIEEEYVEMYAAEAKNHKWPAEAFKMPSESLDFPDNMFDLTVANYVIFLTPDDGVPAMREVYRTLKPGGTVVYTSWAQLPLILAVRKASLATRSPDAAAVKELPPKWESGTTLAAIAEQAGFEKIRIEKLTQKVPIKSLRLFAQLTWSWLGCPLSTGWTEADEENWDKALDTFVDECESGGLFEKLESGEWNMKTIANVVIATK
ncbi:S-adenosyl-L-methionine-dependent methyltransferase [Lojkania enalia]|uniref:S-adenosyl-L-methionine-dependent methyltransferase n=1 Tax=Lojkania enalia TaxID=147567 RepID=A0A9P4KCM2_9PLEO|nr:S-adenosyl-L-methionine-dependent methyltransferase [Didymosphaeria enalia]